MNLLDSLMFANVAYKNDLKIKTFMTNKCEMYYCSENLEPYKYISFSRNKELFISIRGSANFNNWIDNISGVSIDEGYVTILHDIINILDINCFEKVHITGHSLSGGIAIKLGNRFAEIYENVMVKVRVFAPMKPYRNKFNPKCDILFTEIDGDLATNYPLFWNECGTKIHFDKNLKFEKSTWFNKFKSVILGIFMKNIGIFESHKIETIREALLINETILKEEGLWG